MPILAWLALGCAFAPVIVGLVEAIPKAPFGWSLLLAPVLLVAAAARDPRSAEPNRGYAPILLIIGVLIELAGLGGGSPGIARLGLPISVVGLSLWIGTPRWMIALLAFWALPVPGSLYALTTPTLESAYARIGTAAITALGADLSVSGPLIRSGAEHLELDPTHSGIHLVFMTTLLAWYASARKEVSPLAAVARAAIAAFVAIPLQGVAVSLAIALLVIASPGLANFWLDNGLWLLTAIVGITWIETR